MTQRRASAPGPGESECRIVQAQLWSPLDGECAGPLCEILLRHLDDCLECMDQFVADARLKRLIASKCAGEVAPQRLRRWRTR
jgi:mycothiol system anti-sigma-R factor